MSENKFIKLAQPAPPAPPTPSTPIPAPPTSPSEAARLREEERQRDRLRREQEREDALNAVRSKSKSDMGNFITSFVEQSEKQGRNVEGLNQELESRSRLIRRMLGWMPEDLVAKYFDEFLFKKEIPWTISFPLMDLALKGAGSGIDVQDAMDFVLVHYDEKRNFNLTKDIINGAIDLQPKMRSINLMKMLKDALTGNISSGYNFTVLGPKNIDNFVILNELMQYAVAKPEEDLEAARIKFVKNLDAFNRAREVDDRYKAIFQMLLSDEFNRVMKRNVEFVTQMFKGIATKPEFLAMRRILISLKMGEALRDQIFSDLEQKKTAPTEIRSNSSKNIKIAQQQKNVIPESNQEYILNNIINPYINYFNLFVNALKNPQSISFKDKNGKPVTKFNFVDSNGKPINLSEIIADINLFLSTLKSLKTKCQQKTLTSEDFNSYFWKQAETIFSKYQNKARDVFNPNTNVTAEKTSFIKIAQGNQAVANPFQNILNPSSLLDGALKLAGMGTVVSGVLNLDVNKALGGMVLTGLYSDHQLKVTALKNLGLNAPVDTSSPAERIQAQNNIEKLLTASDVQQYQKLTDALDTIDEVIADAEERVYSITEANLATGTGRGTDVNVPLNQPDQVKKAYEDFRALLKRGMQEAEYLRKFVKDALVRSKNDPNLNASILQNQATILAFENSIGRLVEKYRNNYFKFASVTMIAKQMQQVRLLKRQLKTLIPELENYLGAGSSIADLIRIPGGIGERLKGIIDQEKEAKDILFTAISGMEDFIKKSKLISPAPQVVKPETSNSLSQSGSPPPSNKPVNTTSLMPKINPLEQVAKQWASKQLGPQFAGLLGFAEINNDGLIKIANSPQELSETYSAFRFSNIIRESAESSDKRQLRIDHYLAKIKDPKTNVAELQRYIQGKDTQLNNTDRTFLMEELNKRIFNEFQSGTQAFLQAGSQTGLVSPQAAQALSGVGATGAQITPPIIPPITPIPESGTATTVQPQSSSDLSQAEEINRQQLNAIFSNLNKATGLNVSVDYEAVKKEPEKFLESLVNQWQEAEMRYKRLQGIQYQLLTKPITDLGILRDIVSSDHLKFIKLAEQNDKKADQKNIEIVGDYFDELYDNSKDSPEFGEAIKNPQKWRKVPTTKIPEID